MMEWKKLRSWGCGGSKDGWMPTKKGTEERKDHYWEYPEG